MRKIYSAIVVVVFFIASLGNSQPFRPITYTFTNGAKLSLRNGMIVLDPPVGEESFNQLSLPLDNSDIYMLPESITPGTKQSEKTSLQSATSDAPVTLQSRPVQAVPFVIVDAAGNKNLYFALQTGKFVNYGRTQFAHSKLKGLTVRGFSYKVIGFNENEFTVVATVTTKSDAMPTNHAFPWIISSDGTNQIIEKEVPINFTYALDTSEIILIQTHSKGDDVLSIDLRNPKTNSLESKSDYGQWANKQMNGVQLAYVDNSHGEWVSDSNRKKGNYLNRPPEDQPDAPPKAFEKAKPKRVTEYPVIDVDGKPVPVTKVLETFTTKYKLEDLPDFGFKRDDFRSLAIPVFGEPGRSKVVIGESGGGKTTYVEAFARAILNGEFHDKGIDAADTEVIHFSASELGSGTKYVGTIESKIEAVIKYSEWAANNGRHVVWIVDEIASLLGEGVHEGNYKDVFQLLLTPLAKGTVRIVGTTTAANYLKIAAKPDLERRLPAFELAPVSVKDVAGKIENWILAYNKPTLSREYIEYVSQLGIEFCGVGEPLSRAAGLLQQLYDEAAYDQISPEKLDGNKEYALEVASRFYGYNVQNFSVEKLDENLDHIDEKLSHLVGFDELKKEVKAFHVRSVTRSRVANKTDGRFLLISPYGLGKTTLVESVADALGRPYVRIPLSSYADKEMLYADVARAAKKNPYSVLFFDELGDAPRDIIIALNSALDAKTVKADLNYGITAADHTKITVDLSRTQTWAATNAGSTYIEEVARPRRTPSFSAQEEPPADLLAAIDMDKLKARAEQEGLIRSLMDRFKVVPVVYYSEKDFRQILVKHFEETVKKINAKKQTNVILSDEIKEGFMDLLMKKHFSKAASPRDAIGELTTTLENYFAYHEVKDKQPKAAALMRESCLVLLGKEAP